MNFQNTDSRRLSGQLICLFVLLNDGGPLHADAGIGLGAVIIPHQTEGQCADLLGEGQTLAGIAGSFYGLQCVVRLQLGLQ